MKKNILSWLTICFLLGVSMLGLGLKQGMVVGEKNIRNKQIYELEMQKLTPSPTTPTPTKIGFKIDIDPKCNLSYLLPENISSKEAEVEINCGRFTASNEAEFKRQGFDSLNISGKGKIFVKSKDIYLELLKRSIELVTPTGTK
ncbi:MAG: hypothetical protein U0525_01585 [Patescibacteria group bacterium]